MGRHDQMRHSGWASGAVDGASLAADHPRTCCTIRSRAKEASRSSLPWREAFDTPVGQTDDFALVIACNRRMRRVEEAGEACLRSPFILCYTTAQWPSVTKKPCR